MRVVVAPSKEEINFKIFLAGSIELGNAPKWQEDVRKVLNDFDNLTLLDPRRDHWDEKITNDTSAPAFVEQVNWELDLLERSDMIIMYLAPETKSPISLLELGLFAKSNKLIVACPDGFWRKGNVEIVCKRYGVELFNSFDELMKRTKIILKEKNVT